MPRIPSYHFRRLLEKTPLTDREIAEATKVDVGQLAVEVGGILGVRRPTP